jgi:prolyl 4-hydroxylase
MNSSVLSKKKSKQEQEHLAEIQIRQVPLPWFVQAKPLKIKRVCESFPVHLLQNFLSADECKEIIKIGSSKLVPSTVFQKDKIVRGNERISQTAFLTASGIPSSIPVLYGVQLRVASLCWFPLSHLENINMTQYNKNQYYKPHHDFIDPAKQEKENTVQASQRVFTFLIYLNSVSKENGGQTYFPRLNLSVKPKRGSCLVWPNTSFDGKSLYEQTLHEGQELTGGEKWALNVWVRDKPYSGGASSLTPSRTLPSPNIKT